MLDHWACPPQVSVAGSSSVRDGLGFELQPSNTSFWTHVFPTMVAAPTTASAVALFDDKDGGAGQPLRWPLLTQGPVHPEGRSLSGWRVDARDDSALERALQFFVNRR